MGGTRSRQGGILPFQIDLNLLFTMFPSLESQVILSEEVDLLRNRFNVQHNTDGTVKVSSVVDTMIGDRSLPAGSANGAVTGQITNLLTLLARPATESIAGLVKLSTQALTNAGADDSAAITAKKLKDSLDRWGGFGVAKAISSTNANDITLNGIYHGLGITGAPNEGVDSDFFVMNLSSGSASGGGVQIASNANVAAGAKSPMLFVRHQAGTAWSSTWYNLFSDANLGTALSVDSYRKINVAIAHSNETMGIVRLGAIQSASQPIGIVNGVISIQSATPDVLGVCKVTAGNGLSITDGTISMVVGTTEVAGALQVGTGLSVAAGVVNVKYGESETTACRGDDPRLTNARTPVFHASYTTAFGVGTDVVYGHVMVPGGNSNGLQISDGALTMDIASTTKLGTVKIGGNLHIDANGILSVAVRVAGSTSVGVPIYSGTDPLTGCFDGSTTAPTAVARLNYNGYFYATRVYNAFWGDIADFIEVEKTTPIKYGVVYIRGKDGKHAIASKRAQKGCIGLASDTYGYAAGGKGIKNEIPIAVGGFVLAYIDKEYDSGTPLVSNKTGGLTKASLFDCIFRPYIILATFYKPEYDELLIHGDIKVVVNGRHWVKVK